MTVTNLDRGVTETIGDVTFADPFRWLENDADPEVAEWQRQADAKTVAELAASPVAARVDAAVRATFEDLFTATAPERFGDAWFRKLIPEGGRNVVLQVSDSPTGAGRILFDPSQDGDTATIMQSQPSPDGSLVFVAVTCEGAFINRIIRVADGAVIRDEFGSLHYIIAPAWTPDNRGFFFTTMAAAQSADGQVISEGQIWWQPVVGEGERQEVELDHLTTWPIVSPDGRWAAICASQVAARPRWIRRLDGGAWTRFLPDATAMYRSIIVGDEMWSITDDTSGWCRLVAIPLESFADEATWRELVPATPDHKLLSLTQCGGHVALSIIEFGIMRMRSLDLTGRTTGAVPLPGDGAFGLFGLGYIAAIMMPIVAPDGDGCTFVHSTLDRGTAVYRADLAELTIAEVEAPAHQLADRKVERFEAEGPHGPVSYWTMRKASTPLDGSAPVIAMGYGGFNAPEIPHYTAMAAAWTELGGVWVHTQLRGGGDRDKAFWEAGRMHRKQGTFDDFQAVLADLQARGFAVPARTGIWGTSNGGLLVGATYTQRPDLIGAAVAQVPVFDMVQIRKDPQTLAIAMADYGNPSDPADAAVMLAYSPYHNVRPGTAYPALLCDTGAEDQLCPPWHSRKMIAAVEQATTTDRRLRLRVRHGAGHNQMTSERLIQRDVEELTFFYEELHR